MDIPDNRSITSQDCKSQSSGNQIQMMSNSKDNVKVVIRVRPLNDREKGNGGHKKCVNVENELTVYIEAKPDFKYFNFDFVGDENIEQEVIFNKIAKPIADGCLEGYNGSIFAYGQTGAGKTFTIQGPSITVNGEEQIYGSFSSEGGIDQDQRGIMQRSFEYIFDCIEKERLKVESSQDQSQFDFLVRCSYLEIYNEQIMDLLEPTSINLHIREDIKKGVYVEGLQEEVVQSASDMIAIIQAGAKNRHVGCTSMNKESSRSHSVLTTIIETKSMKEGGVWNIKTSRFHIIDLAGSERSKYTNAVGDRLKEAGMINKSLSALGNVINSLVDISEGKSRHVHYRDSKLTFLLRDSLGGNSKTVIIANISPSSICFGETLSTLKFAQRAKLIRNKAIINEDSSGTITLLKSEISRLKKELAENEQNYRNIDNNLDGYQCSLCKALIGNDINQDEDDELLINNISVCEDLDVSVMNTTQSGPLNEVLKQKFKNQKEDLQKMRKRVVHLEGLLTGNLDSLSSQQKFYDNDILKHQQQNKKLQKAVESYEKQCARDKMIIKFREERINKLEQNIPQTKDDQQKIINDLKKEIQMYKDASDHNSQAAKLFAEKADLMKQLESLKNEYKQSPDSLSAQMRTLTEMNESLNQYLKLYCEESKKEVENELSKVKLDYAERIEQLNEKVSEMLFKETEQKVKQDKQIQDLHDMVHKQKVQIERLGLEYTRERQELEQSNKDQIEQIKNEIEQISENKTEQEKEIQMFRIQIIEKESQFLREKESRNELEKQYQHKQIEYNQEFMDLQKSLKDLEESNSKLENKIRQNQEHHDQLFDHERKQNTQFIKEKQEQWEENMKQLERKILEESSEKQMLEEQCEQCNDRIRSLEQDNETVQQSLLYKEEQILELEGAIREKERSINTLDEQKVQLQQTLQVNDQTSTAQLEDLSTQLNELKEQYQDLQSKLQSAIRDKQDLQDALNEIKQEIQELILQREELQQQVQSHLIKIESQSEKICNLEDLIEQRDEELINLKKDIHANEAKINLLESDSSQQIQQMILEKEQAVEQVKNLISDISQLKTENQTQQEQWQEQINKIQAESQQEQENVKIELEQKLKSLQIISDKQMLEVKLETESLIQEVQILQQNLSDFEGKIKLQEQQIIEINQEKESIIIENFVKIATLQEDQNAQILKINMRCEVQIKQHQDLIQEKVTQYESSIEQIEIQAKAEKESAINEMNDQITSMKESYEQQIQNQQDETQLKIQSIETEKQNKQLESQLKVEEIQQQLIAEIEIINIQKEQEIQAYQEQIQTIQKEREEDIQEFKQLQSMNYEQKQTELIKEIEQKEIFIKETTEQLIVKHETELKQIQDQLSEQLADKQEQIQSIIIEKQQLVQQLQQVLDQSRIQIEQITEQQEESTNDLSQQLQDVQNQLLDQNELTEIAQSQLNDKEIQLQKCNQKIEQFTQQVQDLISQKSKIQDLLQQSQSENQTLSNQIDTSLAQNEGLQRESTSIQSDLQETLISNKALQDQLLEQMKQVSELQKELDNQKQQSLLIKQQLTQLQSQYSSNEQGLQEELIFLRQEVESLGSIKQDLSTKINRFESLQKQNEKDKEDLYQQIQEREELFQQIEGEYQQQNSVIEEEQIKNSNNEKQLQILQQDLKRQKLLLDDTINSLNNEHFSKYQEQEQQFSARINVIKQESESYKQHAKELNHQIAKLRQDNDEQNQMLKSSKDTISRMVQKENELMKELEKNINEFKDKHEKSKRRLEESREQSKQIKFEWEKSRKENENLKELIKLKDRQIEEQLNSDERDKQSIDKIMKENKDLRNQLTKREFEMKDLVRTLKFYSEEKTRLEKEIEKLNRENDQLIGNKNPNYKIQYHVKIKEDNNRLKEENSKLQEELRRKIDMITKFQKGFQGDQMSMMMDTSQIVPQSKQDLEQMIQILKDDLKKYKKENMTYQETINRLVDHILSQPGLFKAIGLTEETNDKLMQQSGPVKVKKAMEIISMLSNLISTKEREVKDLEREIKKYECRLDIVEKEKILCKQQIELMSNPNMGAGSGAYSQNTSGVYQKRSPINNHHQEFMMIQNQNELQQPKQPSRIHVEGFLDDKSQNEFMGISKQSPSPIFNIRQQKEKENINSSKLN